MSNIDKERSRLDFIKSREGMHTLMRQENLPDWYVIEYADEICDIWDEFIKYHGISQEIRKMFQTEILNFHNKNSPFSIFSQPYLTKYWDEYHTNISTAKKVFYGYENQGLYFSFNGKTVSFKDKLYDFRFEIAIDFKLDTKKGDSRNILSIIIYDTNQIISSSESLYGLPIRMEEHNFMDIYSNVKKILDSNRKNIYTLIMSQKDIESTIQRGSTLKSESNILELQDEIKTLTKKIKTELKEGLQKICQNLSDSD